MAFSEPFQIGTLFLFRGEQRDAARRPKRGVGDGALTTTSGSVAPRVRDFFPYFVKLGPRYVPRPRLWKSKTVEVTDGGSVRVAPVNLPLFVTFSFATRFKVVDEFVERRSETGHRLVALLKKESNRVLTQALAANSGNAQIFQRSRHFIVDTFSANCFAFRQ